MPIFEYVCESCNQSFEKLVTKSEKIACPNCQSESLTKQYSRFGMKAESAKSYESLPQYKSGGCGCTPSSCGCKN